GLTMVAIACGDDDAPEADPQPAPDPQPPEVRTRVEERRFAGLDALLVRPVGSGRFPLLVFVHGAGAPPALYQPLLEDLARAGHVVVAPAVPGSVDRAGFQAALSLPFQPGRIRAVIDAVTRGNQRVRAADADHIAVIGHDLGAMAALATGFNTCCQDTRIDAVVSIAGRLGAFQGIFGNGNVPVLLVHGDADRTVPIGSSEDAMQQVGTTGYLLTVLGGDHVDYLGRRAERYPAVLATIEAFLDATVGGDPRGGLVDLRNAGSQPGVRLTSRG
ncbi:MAG TPA: alpha/beta fold hydrolase, partial [Acidimicrobiales bacterium]|nr:alpha/beta fold hydrolase [Acidimicrobiales bacterium]